MVELNEAFDLRNRYSNCNGSYTARYDHVLVFVSGTCFPFVHFPDAYCRLLNACSYSSPT